YCHDVDKSDQGVAERVIPAMLPDRWFTHSVFQHDAHRMLQCESCHAGVKESKLTSDVLLPGVDNCRKCHGPDSLASGRASDACVECHLYHNHKLDRDFNGPFPLDPSQWSGPPATAAPDSPPDSQSEPPAPQAAAGHPSGTVGMISTADIMRWLHD